VFIAFSAEELGLIGSHRYVQDPIVPLDHTVAMLNLDMVGRLRENRLAILGGETAKEWSETVVPACERAQVGCELRPGGYGPSDHMAFYAAGVPVLHFFTGAHRDYHRPTDDVDLINAAGAAQAARLVAEVAQALSARDGRLSFHAGAAPEPPGDLRYSGAALGTVPDYGGPPGGQAGVLLAGVRPGGPADTAGLRRGDILIKIDAHDVRNVEDLMFVLANAKPGTKAKVTVLREGKRLELEATYGKSTRR